MISRRLLHTWFAALTILGLACSSGNPGDSESSSGGSTSGTSSQGGTTNKGNSGGTTSSACEEFPDETGTEVEIVVTNQRSGPIYVGSRQSLCNWKNQFSIVDAAANVLNIETDSCFTCGDLATKGACVYSCGRSPLNRVLPGASFMLRWSGTTFQTQSIAVACRSSWPETCPQEKAVPSGTYVVHVVASSAVGCYATELGDCKCVENDNCQYDSLYAYAYGAGESYDASAEIQVPNQTRAVVTFKE